MTTRSTWMLCVGLICTLCADRPGAQNISVFRSVVPTGQTPVLRLPPTHTFQVLAQTGDSLADGSYLNTQPDFTAYVPKYSRSDLGYLSLNHEIGGLQGGVTVFDLQFDTRRKLWSTGNGAAVNMDPVEWCSRPCSGAVTPWGTVIFGEESLITTDLDDDGYNDAGWLVEVDPMQRRALRKIWKAGNGLHENCTLSSDEKTLYWGADDPVYGFVFKYVADKKRDLSSGRLYVLIRNGPDSDKGYWLPVPNYTPEQCNQVNAFCASRSAWNFAGVEDVEIGPYGRIYFAAKYSGRVWRFRDNGVSVSSLEVFVENTTYPIQTEEGEIWVDWGVGADNLAFDNADNLWVLQDGGANNIWMVKPTHSAAHPQVYLFATTPRGCEPTGITFTPSKRYMFLSFQHPYSINTDTLWDAAGKPVVFNRGTTVVIARQEFLGSGDTGQAPHENTELDLTIAPNPAESGRFFLQSALFHQGDTVDVVVQDTRGRNVLHSRLIAAGQTLQVNFPEKEKGIFYVTVRHYGKVQTAVLVVD